MHTRSFKLYLSILLLSAGCLGLTYLALELLGVAAPGIDDAYIFFVYADNLIGGEGFVYNAGGEQVEGFSSLAWVLLLAALFGSGLGPEHAILLASVLAGISLCALWGALLQLCNAAGEAASATLLCALGAAWMCASPGWFLWTIGSGMDLVLWTCLLSSTTLLLVSDICLDSPPRVRMMGVLLSFMVLARPEAMVWVPFFWLVLVGAVRGNSVLTLRTLLFPVLLPTLTFVALLVFRLAYFGYPLPNTYYAKVSPDTLFSLQQGWAYLREVIAGAGFAGLGVMLAWVRVAQRLPSVFRLLGGVAFDSKLVLSNTVLAAVVAVACVVTVIKGGDHFGGARFFQPVYPLVFVYLASEFLLLQRDRYQPSAVAAGGIFLLSLLLFGVVLRGAWFNIDRTGIRPEFQVALEGQATAERLRSWLDGRPAGPLPEVAVTAAGGFKYSWEGRVLDLMGLNDVAMGHAPGDRKGYPGHAAFNADVFFARRPEIVMPHLEGWPDVVTDCEELRDPAEFYARVLNGLQVSPEFLADYAFTVVPVGAERLCMFVREDYRQSIGAAQ